MSVTGRVLHLTVHSPTKCYPLAAYQITALSDLIAKIEYDIGVRLYIDVVPFQDDTRLPMIWVRDAVVTTSGDGINRLYIEALKPLLNFADNEGLQLRIDNLTKAAYDQIVVRSSYGDVAILRKQRVAWMQHLYNILRNPWNNKPRF